MPSRPGVAFTKQVSKAELTHSELQNRPTSVSRVMREIAKAPKTRGDGLHVDQKFRDEHKEKWISPDGFRVPTSATLLQNLK